MIIVHHLNNSRSQRVLWLLEELGLDYEIKRYLRDPNTQRAPAELKTIHPLGKSPIIEDGDLMVAETGAIVDYLVETYGQDTLRPAKDSLAFYDYMHFLHYGEGSAMFPFLLALYVGFLDEAGAPLNPIITAEIKTQLDYIEYHLTTRTYFAGEQLSGADIMMIFPLEAAKARGRLLGYEACLDYVNTMQARPAYLRALKRAGDNYAYGPKI